MVFNFGAWDQGVDKSKAEFKAKRAENANLYSDYIRQNPDSSVEQRAAFSQNLAGNSNFLKNAMPTRDVMMQNVSRRKTQLANAASARKRAELNSNIALAKNLAPIYSSSLLAGGEKDALSAITEISGGVLPAAALPLVQQFGKAEAKRTFQTSFQPTFENWKAAGARPEDIKQWGSGVSEGAKPFLNDFITQATATMQGMSNRQYSAALDAGTQIANSGDQVAFDNYLSNLSKVNPHLSNNPEKLNEVSRSLTEAFNVGLTLKNQKLEAAVKTGTTAAADAFSSGTYNSPEQAYNAVIAEARIVDPNFELSTESKVEIDQAWETYLKQQNRVEDLQEQAEATQKAMELNGKQFVAFDGDLTDASKSVEVFAQTLVADDVKNREQAVSRVQANIVTEINDFANDFSVPLNDGDNGTFQSLARKLTEAASEYEGDTSQVSASILRAEANRIMAQRSTNPSDLQAQAFKAALGGMTLNEIATKNMMPTFKSNYEQRLRALTVASIDVLEEATYSPLTIGEEITSTAERAKQAVDTAVGPGADGVDLITRANTLINEVYGGGPGTGSTGSLSLPEISSKSADQAGQLSNAARELVMAGRSLEERIRRATAQIERDQFAGLPEQTNAVRKQIEAMRKQEEMIGVQLGQIKSLHSNVIGQTMQFTQKSLGKNSNIEDLNAVADILVLNFKQMSGSSTQIESFLDTKIDGAIGPATYNFSGSRDAMADEIKRVVMARMLGNGKTAFNQVALGLMEDATAPPKRRIVPFSGDPRGGAGPNNGEEFNIPPPPNSEPAASGLGQYFIPGGQAAQPKPGYQITNFSEKEMRDAGFSEEEIKEQLEVQAMSAGEPLRIEIRPGN
jgi:hypothetical protein